MFDQQITTIENRATSPGASVPGIDVEIVAVDMAVLLSFEELQQANETDLLVELIELYLEDAPVKIAALRQSMTTADIETFKHAAHNLKGSSGTLGVRQLALVCEELECLAEAGLTPGANELLERLDEEFVRVRDVLTAEIHRRRVTYHAGV